MLRLNGRVFSEYGIDPRLLSQMIKMPLGTEKRFFIVNHTPLHLQKYRKDFWEHCKDVSLTNKSGNCPQMVPFLCCALTVKQLEKTFITKAI